MFGKKQVNVDINKLTEEFQRAVAKALGSDDSVKAITDLTTQTNLLKSELAKTKDTLAEVQSKKKIDLMEIEHMIKIKEEKNAIEYTKKELALDKQYNDKEMILLKKYHTDTLELIDKTKSEFKDLYTKILDRLPNVSMEIHKGSNK